MLKNKKLIASILMVLCIASCLFCLTACSDTQADEKVDEPITIDKPEDSKDKIYPLGNINFTGASDTAPKSVTVKAKVYPFNASDKSLNWSVAWKNPNSTFATGKTVTDYVTVSATAGDTTIATVTALQAFGETILLTATSVSNPEVSATVCVDYLRIIDTIEFNLSYTKGGVTQIANFNTDSFSNGTTTYTIVYDKNDGSGDAGLGYNVEMTYNSDIYSKNNVYGVVNLSFLSQIVLTGGSSSKTSWSFDKFNIVNDGKEFKIDAKYEYTGDMPADGYVHNVYFSCLEDVFIKKTSSLPSAPYTFADHFYFDYLCNNIDYASTYCRLKMDFSPIGGESLTLIFQAG